MTRLLILIKKNYYYLTNHKQKTSIYLDGILVKNKIKDGFIDLEIPSGTKDIVILINKKEYVIPVSDLEKERLNIYTIYITYKKEYIIIDRAMALCFPFVILLIVFQELWQLKEIPYLLIYTAILYVLLIVSYNIITPADIHIKK